MRKNLKLLRAVRDQILKEPKQFVMGHFFTRSSTNDTAAYHDAPRGRIPNCGTAACIAGWAISLKHGLAPDQAALLSYWRNDEPTRAQHALGLDYDQRQALFYVECWPVHFQEAYAGATTARGKAEVAAARIDRFIETGE